ncbi:hypothetical protein L1887_23965 [Cichorium endivia]|nr:hypothetical protein L1887_23965 [Cichorium endivia]
MYFCFTSLVTHRVQNCDTLLPPFRIVSSRTQVTFRKLLAVTSAITFCFHHSSISSPTKGLLVFVGHVISINAFQEAP